MKQKNWNSKLYFTMITGGLVRTGLAEREKGSMKAVWEAMEKPWAVALGVEKKRRIGEVMWLYCHQNLETDYMVEGEVGDRDEGVQPIHLKSE